MKVIGLISGGKDSIFNLMECVKAGHEPICLAHLIPRLRAGKWIEGIGANDVRIALQYVPQRAAKILMSGLLFDDLPSCTIALLLCWIDETDSYMYQSVGHDALPFIAQAMRLPLRQRVIQGLPKHVDLTYTEPCPDDEVEDLFFLLQEIVQTFPEAEAVSVGAIASTYQTLRVRNVAERLNLKVLAYLWERDQKQLVQEMIDAKMHAILIKTAGMGLNKKHIGMSIKDIYPYLLGLNEKWGFHVAGEGGEFESLVLDCPLYHKALKIIDSNIICHADTDDAPVYYMKIKQIELINK